MAKGILSEINLQQIINFISVVEQGGFLAASEHLHMTQAAISRSIIRLEDTLGIALFVSEQKGRRSFRSPQLIEGTQKQLNDLYTEIVHKHNEKVMIHIYGLKYY